MTGLARTGGQFFIFLATVFMASVFGSAICFFVSTLATTFGKLFSLIFMQFFYHYSRGSDYGGSDLRRHDGVQRVSN